MFPASYALARAQSSDTDPILKAHSVGPMDRDEAEALLAARARGKGDFVVRDSKGVRVVTALARGGVYKHIKVKAGSDGAFTVNGKPPTGLPNCKQLSKLLDHWLADQSASRADVGATLVHVEDENSGAGSGSGFRQTSRVSCI